ncbi:MAG: NAD(P)/FAD-dependent oxidoreductase [Candidatus Nitrosocaldus sp.]
MSMYDVIVVGGSISGLLAAREIARRGFSVLVLEEDAEIGTPEHCGGLVSIDALNSLGIEEYRLLSRIRYATISVLDTTISIDAESKNVIAIDRRALDKHVAKQARRNGADMMLMCRARSFAVRDGYVKVDTNRGMMECKVLVDARGCSIPAGTGKGFLPSAQYEVDSACWIDADRVEVYIDQDKYPGFFAWIIPGGKERGRVGVSGKGINAMDRIEQFIAMKEGKYMHGSNTNCNGVNGNNGRCVTLRKVFAPIWIDGPRRPFVKDGRVVVVGDAAGQAKPTTAGGIYTSGMGGLLAGTTIADALANNNLAILNRYEDAWLDIFGKEFEKMLMLRRLFERLDNKAIERILNSVYPHIDEISASGDFDFHSSALARMIMSIDGLRVVKAVLGSEFRRFLAGIAKV